MATFKKTAVQAAASKLFGSQAREFLLLGGSRSGKTFIIIYTLVVLAIRYPGSRQLIARLRFNHVKNSVWNDTLKKVLDICFPGLDVHWNYTDHYISISQNGLPTSEIWIAGLDDKERIEKILGMEFMSIHLNEASQISYNAYTIIKTRLAQKVLAMIDGVVKEGRRRIFIDENPPSKKHWTYRVFYDNIEPESGTQLNPVNYAKLKMNPDQNLENIGSDYLDILDTMPEAKRKRFRDGEFSDDSQDALWSSANIAATRVITCPPLKRIVVAVDPATTSEEGSDDTGIGAAGLGYDDHLYVLADWTDKLKPKEWATSAVQLYNEVNADRIVGEVNNGGDLVETVIRTVDGGLNVPYEGVYASKDKRTRAEPVATLWELGKAHIVGELPELETEMTTWAGRKGEKSPNRIDWLVWAAAELMPEMNIKKRKPPRIAS